MRRIRQINYDKVTEDEEQLHIKYKLTIDGGNYNPFGFELCRSSGLPIQTLKRVLKPFAQVMIRTNNSIMHASQWLIGFDTEQKAIDAIAAIRAETIIRELKNISN